MSEAEKIQVLVNGTPLTLYRGMQVQHALIAFDQAVYKACLRGDLIVEDGRGFQLDLGGALQPGATIVTKRR